MQSASLSCGPRRSRRVGVIGFGRIGQYLVGRIQQEQKCESGCLKLAFVWNRTPEILTEWMRDGQLEEKQILRALEDIKEGSVDLVVECAHPDITEQFAESLLQFTDYMICSPTALAKQATETRLRRAAITSGHTLYIPSGALWGSDDINKMADMGTIQRLKITMSFHPESLKLNSPLKELNSSVINERTILYQGSVRELCPLAPNNVNTMAAASLAAHNLGMDNVEGCLVSDPGLADFHVVEVDVWGEGDIESEKVFHVRTVRQNPASPGQLTGAATMPSLFASILRARHKSPGVRFC